MDDLIAFVTARLDEKAQRALGTVAGKAEADARTVLPWLNELAPPVPRDEAALREVEAGRAILARYGSLPSVTNLGEHLQRSQEQAGLGYAIRLLAAVWSDHPDYRPEWKP